jgi:hypothetical protein
MSRHPAGFGHKRSEERRFCPFDGHVKARLGVRAVSEQLAHRGGGWALFSLRKCGKQSSVKSCIYL